MNARRRFTFKRWVALGLALGAVGTATAQAATRPDDRAGTLGVGGPAIHSSPARPDDRAGLRGVESDVVTRYLNNRPAAVRPDDRAGIRGVGPVAALTPAAGGSGSSWDVVGIAAGSSLGALGLALAGITLARRRRSATAAFQS